MGREGFGEAGGPGGPADHHKGGLAGKGPVPLSAREDMIAGPTPQPLGPLLLQVGPDGLDDRAADRHHPLFVALAQHPDQPGLQVDGRQIQVHDLADPQPGAIKQGDHRPIPQGRKGQHRPHLGLGHGLREPLAQLGQGHQPRRIGLQGPLFDQPSKEAPDRDQHPGLAARRQTGLGQAADPTGDVFTADRRRRLPARLDHRAREVAEIPAISLQGVVGEAPLHPQVQQVTIDLGVEGIGLHALQCT